MRYAVFNVLHAALLAFACCCLVVNGSHTKSWLFSGKYVYTVMDTAVAICNSLSSSSHIPSKEKCLLKCVRCCFKWANRRYIIRGRWICPQINDEWTNTISLYWYRRIRITQGSNRVKWHIKIAPNNYRV